MRLKDLLIILSRNKAITDIAVMTTSGNRVFRLHNALSKNVVDITFTKITNFTYSCTLTISFIDNGYTEDVKYLRFSDIEKCVSKDTLILPVDSKYNKTMIQENENIANHYNCEVVENLLPIFTKEYTILQLILSDNLNA